MTGDGGRYVRQSFDGATGAATGAAANAAFAALVGIPAADARDRFDQQV